METLTEILDLIKCCNGCWLMADNKRLNIPLIPFHCKPEAKYIFIGRDPSPRTVKTVGLRGGKSVFINEIFEIVDNAGISDEDVYITDLCKCHWRTSRGTPWEGTESRSSKLPGEIGTACIKTWLFREIAVLKPKAIFCFGEELYSQLQPFVVTPANPPGLLSATKDKSLMDAELYFVEKGPMKIKLGETETIFVPLRHAGNSTSLPKQNVIDKRWNAYQASKTRAIELLRNLR